MSCALLTLLVTLPFLGATPSKPITQQYCKGGILNDRIRPYYDFDCKCHDFFMFLRLSQDILYQSMQP